MPGKPVAHVTSIIKGGLVATGSGSVFVGDVGMGNADTCLSCRPTTGSPVNPILGVKVLPAEIDFALPAPSVFAFARSYNSGDARCGPLGHGWALPGTSMAVECAADSTVLFDPEGRRIHFPALAPGQALFSPTESLWIRRGGPVIPQAHPPSSLSQPQDGHDNVLAPWTGRWAAVPEAMQHNPRVLFVRGQGGCLVFCPANPLSASTLHPKDPQVQAWLLIASIDDAGYVTRFEWDGQGLLTRVKDSAGRVYLLSYTSIAQGAAIADLIRLQGVVLCHGTDNGLAPSRQQLQEADWLVRYDHDPHGNLLAVRNRAGQVVREFSWTPEHLMASHGQPGGIHTRYQWGHASNPAAAPGPGRQARVVQQDEAEGLTRRYHYFEDRTEVRDSMGRCETYHFKGEGGLKRWTGHTRAEVDGQASHVAFEYDGFGRLICSTDALGRKTHVRRDGQGRAIGSTGPDGGTTLVTLDEQTDLPLKIQDAEGRITTFERDALGNVVCETRPDGRTTRYRYEHPGLPDRPSHIIDPLGKAKTLQYSRLGQLTQYTDCSGHSQSWTYDGEGRLVRSSNALGQATQIHYDALSQPVRRFLPDGSSVQTEWDALGRQVRVTVTGAAPASPSDPGSPPPAAAPQRVVQYRWDRFGRLIGKMDPAGRTLRLRYDAAGRLVQLQNENEASTVFQYDALDRLTQETGFDGRAQHYRYNAVGELTEKWEGTPEAPQLTRYAYDNAGRIKTLSRLAEPAGNGPRHWQTDTFEWSKTGQLLSARSAAATVSYAYDAAGGLSQEVQTHADGWRYQVQHSHHLQEQQRLSTYGDLPALRWLTYGPGHLHGLRWELGMAGGSETAPVSIELDFERDALHRETSRSSNGSAPGGGFTQQRAYDAGGNLLGTQTQFAGPLVGSTPWTRRHHYDALGQLVGTLDQGGTPDAQPHRPHSPAPSPSSAILYRYDASGRLVGSVHRAQDGNATEHRYRFDPAGNRLSLNTDQASGQPLVSDNRVVQLDGLRCNYDAAGNLVTKTWPDGSRLNLTYDAANRLLELQRTSADGGITQARYEYDSFSRRVAKHVSTWVQGRTHTRSTRFGWDGERLVYEETDHPTEQGPRRLQRTTVYEPGSFVPLLRVEQLSEAAPSVEETPATTQETQAWAQMTELLERQGLTLPAALQDLVQATRVSFFHTDHLGTPLKLTDAHGHTLWQARNDDWGAVRNEQGSTDQPIRFQGQWVDEESGFFYNRYRYYDSATGRYTQSDPIGLIGGINTYAYVSENPIESKDPLGLKKDYSEQETGAILRQEYMDVRGLGGITTMITNHWPRGKMDVGWGGPTSITGQGASDDTFDVGCNKKLTRYQFGNYLAGYGGAHVNLTLGGIGARAVGLGLQALDGALGIKDFDWDAISAPHINAGFLRAWNEQMNITKNPSLENHINTNGYDGCSCPNWTK
jgi:RHS repeat-associated protein